MTSEDWFLKKILTFDARICKLGRMLVIDILLNDNTVKLQNTMQLFVFITVYEMTVRGGAVFVINLLHKKNCRAN